MLIYILYAVFFGVLIYLSHQDYKDKEVGLVALSLLVVDSIFLQYFNLSNLREFVNAMDFALVFLGIIVLFELFATTFLNTIVAKYNSDFQDSISIGIGDFPVFFSIALILNSFNKLISFLIILGIVVLIFNLFNKKEKEIALIPFLSVSLVIELVFKINFVNILQNLTQGV